MDVIENLLPLEGLVYMLKFMVQNFFLGYAVFVH